MKIEYMKIDKIKPYKQNARFNHKAIDKVAESISQFGFKQPIVVDKDNVIICGHTRYKASKKLDLKEIPILRANDLTKEQVKAYRLADNKTADFSEWDNEKLKLELYELTELDFDMKPFGFEPLEFKQEKDADDFDLSKEVDEIEEPTSQKGDIFILGNHRLMCGDSTNENDVKKLLNGNKIQMSFTDPPYNINYGNIKHPKFKQREIENDNMSKNDFKVFCNKFIRILSEYVDGCIYMAGPPGPPGRIMFMEADNIMNCSTTIIWEKDNFSMGRGKYQNGYEPLWFGWSKKGKLFSNDRNLTNIWKIDRPKNSKLHPTMKPIELVETALDHASLTNNNILDLFGGSGSTLIACENLNRNCYMMELDPKYCDVIIKRWEEYTNKKAVKEN
jgi:DNA modification methylase